MSPSHPAVMADVATILLAVQLDVSREERRKLEEALFVALVSSRRQGAEAERLQCAGLVACKALLYIADKDQAAYRALKAAERAIRDRDA